MFEDLWPDDIFASPIDYPTEIVKSAISPLTNKSSGRIYATISEVAPEKEDQRAFEIVVQSDLINYSQTIFGLSFSETLPYPVYLWAGKKIFLRSKSIINPDYKEDLIGRLAIQPTAPMYISQDEWVDRYSCTTPKELIEQLERAFGSSYVKSVLVSILANINKPKNT